MQTRGFLRALHLAHSGARAHVRAFGFVVLLTFSACGGPTLDLTSEAGRAGMYDAAIQALTRADCITAIYYADLLYNSEFSTNEIRLLRASAHACNAGLNFFSALDTLSTSSLVGNLFFRVVTQLFPYGSRYGLDSSFYALDATQAMIRPGYVPNVSYAYNSTTNNPATVSTGDRTDNSNLYAMLLGMVTMGKAQNLYGAPNATYQPTTALPWTTPALMTTDGCAYVAGILNAVEGSSAIAAVATGALKTQLQSIGTNLSAVLTASCEQGCMGVLPTGCALPAGTCTPCPAQIRQRNGCTTQAELCAAAGIVNFVNLNPLGWN